MTKLTKEDLIIVLKNRILNGCKEPMDQCDTEEEAITVICGFLVDTETVTKETIFGIRGVING